MLEYARRALVVQHRMPAPGSYPVAMLTSLHKRPSFEEKFMRKVRKHRLYHDLEQLHYLNLTDSAIAAYEEILSQFPDAARGDMMLTLSWEQWLGDSQSFFQPGPLLAASCVSGQGRHLESCSQLCFGTGGVQC